MSFRIDDILKKEPKIESEKCEKKSECHSLSILQRTLNNRQSVPYYRSVSEPHAGSSGSWCQSERLFYGGDHFDTYGAKAISYPNIYPRSPVWPNYPSFPLTFFPQLCHFSKRKGGQVRFTANQTDALEKRFTSHKYLSPEDRKILADSLKLTDRQIDNKRQIASIKLCVFNTICLNDLSADKLVQFIAADKSVRVDPADKCNKTAMVLITGKDVVSEPASEVETLQLCIVSRNFFNEIRRK